MPSLGEAVLHLVGDDSQLQQDVEGAKSKVSASLKNIGGSMQKAGMIATASVTAPLVGIGGAAISSASDVSESMNAVNVVFGEAADAVLNYSAQAAKSAGLAKSEFNQMSAETGAMLINMGMDQRAAADESVNLAQRAADMASIFNTDVSQALGAIQAGLRGEGDPLEKFGVKMRAAAVDAKALEMGLADSKEELDDQARAQAALALIYEQTDSMQGDFVNTSDELANSTRIAKAELKNVAAELGKELLPVALEVVTVIRDLVDRFSNLSPQAKKTIVIVGAIAAALGPVLMFLGTMISAIGTLIGAWGTISTVLGVVAGVLTGPVALAIAAVIAVVGALYLAWKHNFLGIRDTFKTVWSAIQSIWKAFKAALQGDWRGFGEYLREAWDKIWGLIRQRFEKAKQTLINIGQRIIQGIKNLFKIDWGEVGRSIVRGIANGITAGIKWIRNAAKNAAKAALDAAKGFLGIKSPSSLMEKEIGWNMGAGVGLGFERSLANIQSGMQGSLGSLTNTLARSPSPAASMSSSQKEINIEINNPVPESAEKSLSREMNRLSYLGVT